MTKMTTATRTTLIAVLSAAAIAGCGKAKEKDAPAKQPTAPAAPTAGTATGPGTAAAPAAPPTTPTKAAPAPAAARAKGPIPPAYRDALARGRKLAAAKQLAEAAAAFREALVAVPDDPRALSELSWVLFQAKDLAAAKPIAEQAVKLGKNNVKAASLYNLGRILEAEGANADAANAYRESLAMRPNKTVAEHLAKVDPTARPGTMLAIEEWGPPIATLPTSCEGLGEDDQGYAEWSQDGACGVTITEVTLGGAAGSPFQAVTQIARKRSGSDEAFVAVQTADGWLLSPPFLSWGGVGTWGATGTVTKAEVVTHPTLGPVLRLDVRTSENGRWENWNTESTVFCQASRAGGSGALTCTPLLATSWLHTQDEDDAVDEACAAAIAFEADGAVALTSKTGKSPADCPIPVGRLTWPPAR